VTPAVILPTWCIVVLCSLVTAAGACSTGVAPVEVRGQLDGDEAPAVEVRVIVQREHRRDAARYLRGAVAALGTMTAWVGPCSRPSMTVVDPPWHAPAGTDAATVVLPRTPWWSSTTSMAAELAAARGVAARGWSEALDPSALPAWFTAGLVEYSARRAVTPLFQGENLSPGYAMYEGRYLGGFVPWFVRIRLLPERDGDPLPAYRAHSRVDIDAPASVSDERSLVAKTVLTLATLERWISRPVFDGVLAEFVRTFRGRRATIDGFIRVASATAGQDVAWLLGPTLGGSATFDYAVSGLRSAAGPGGLFDTTVVVERRGDGVFAGTSAPRQGPFDSGRGVTVEVVFEDGARVVDAWDGRDVRRELVYRSRSRAVSATVDPDQRILLDVNRTNNSATVAPRAAAAATRWALRWMVWLQHAVLTYAALV
jgi:hypothetical protein